ncbi:phage tail protein, partial [Escherichia coli]|uniref:phage tail protein n=1 Tax=Escherichia coli TaxID=562 RepID=UPI0028DAA5C4
QAHRAGLWVIKTGLLETQTVDFTLGSQGLRHTPGDIIEICDNVNRPGFPGECFICELRLPDHRFRWKHNKLFLLLPEEYGPAFP